MEPGTLTTGSALRRLGRIGALAAGVAVLPLLAAASSGASSAKPRVAGCGGTALHRGNTPHWTAPAWSNSSGSPALLPFAIGVHHTVAAFLFGYPLRAGNPSNSSNKILWIVRLPRNGSNLVIRATPVDARAPVVIVTRPADSSPGEIYPSEVDVPSAGCWHLTLHWAHHSDAVDLPYIA